MTRREMFVCYEVIVLLFIDPQTEVKFLNS